MHILVLGNGFDLAHDLKTTYRDFLDYCSKNKMNDKQYSQNLWLQHFINKPNLGTTWIDLEKEIYDVLTNFLYKDLIDKFKVNAMKFELKKNTNNFSFYDIKNYLISYSRKTVEQTHYKIMKETGVYTESLNVYIENEEGFANFLYDQLRSFTKLFEDYLLEEINKNQENKYKLSLQSIEAKEGGKDIYVVSFNYTDTCQRFYTDKVNNYSNIKNFKPIYVHGNATYNDDYKDCKLVLGTKSFNTPGNKVKQYDIPVCFNIFQKHNQRHKYGTIEPYQDFIRALIEISEIDKNNIPIFHVIGHSLDETDHNILEHIFNVNKKSIINIYYHDELAQQNLINNITNIIGENEVMTRVRFIHQHNESRSILKELNPTELNDLSLI